jgi:uroporphyrinogen-III synthase
LGGDGVLTVLITRPRQDSLLLKAEVEALGYAVMIEPLLAIAPIDQPALDLDDAQLLVLTSAHAVPALGERARTYPIYAVGEATAAAARAAGCARVHAAEGNVDNLARLIVENCRSSDGSVLHLSGEVIRGGLAEILNEHGFHYRRHLAYRAIPASRLSAATIDAWQRRVIRAVLLFSPRSAEILVALLRRHRLERHVDSTAAICLSENTAMPCKGLAWKDIRPAARPDRAALLRALVGSTAIC